MHTRIMGTPICVILRGGLYPDDTKGQQNFQVLHHQSSTPILILHRWALRVVYALYRPNLSLFRITVSSPHHEVHCLSCSCRCIHHLRHRCISFGHYSIWAHQTWMWCSRGGLPRKHRNPRLLCWICLHRPRSRRPPWWRKYLSSPKTYNNP